MNLCHFAEQLESGGELLRVSARIDPAFEMAEITDRCSKTPALNKALLFQNNGSPFPVLMNMMGSQRRMCMALGVRRLEDIPQRIDALWDTLTTPKMSVWDKLKLLPTLAQAARWMPRRTRPPQNRVQMRPPDLSRLPITTSWEWDAGRFITLPCVHTQDLHTGARNVGMYRMQVLDNQTTAMHWHIHKTGARHFAQYREAQKRMPVAVTLGGSPLYAFCAAAPLPDGLDEYLLAGFLQNRPVPLMPCLTQPLCVPADADFVIEGYIDPQEKLVTEGPFGDHTGFYSLPDLYPAFHVTAITHAPNAVYPATLVGAPPQEDAYIAMAVERIFLPLIQKTMLPEIQDIHMPPEGVAHNIAIVKIKKQYAGQAHKTANALWGAGQMMFNKILIVTDGSVDIRSPAALERLARERFDPSVDVYFGKGTLDILDHAAQELGYGGKMCIDLTLKNNAPSPSVSALPLFAFVHKGAEPQGRARITAEFDPLAPLDNLPLCLWLLGCSIDPARDCRVQDGILRIDASAKPRIAGRAWAAAACSPPAVIERIDRQWSALGLGAFAPSPSRSIAALNPRHAAEGIVKN